MSLYQVQKLIYQIHNQLDLRAQFNADPNPVMADFKLTEAEKRALLEKDIGTLISRLSFIAFDSNFAAVILGAALAISHRRRSLHA